MVMSIAQGWSIPPVVANSVDAEIQRRQSQQADAAVQVQTGASPQAQTQGLNVQAAQSGVASSQQQVMQVIGSRGVSGNYVGADGTIDEQQALLDLQRAQLDPAYMDQMTVQAAQRALQVAQSAEYRVAVQALAARKNDLARLTAAQDNIANQAQVAAGRRDQSVYDPRYGMAGLQVQEIQRPLDGSGDINLPPGVRYALESDAEYQQRVNDRNAALRGVTLDESNLTTQRLQQQLQQQLLSQSQNEAARQRALDEAQLNVSQAQINEKAKAGATSTGSVSRKGLGAGTTKRAGLVGIG